MRSKLPILVLGGAAAAVAAPAAAADLNVSIQIPQLKVAEYHRPYVAVWLEGPDGAATTLAALYDVKKANQEGEKWLKDMRQWWRKSGRDLNLPADGVSGATRAPGTHTLNFGGQRLAKLPPGQYQLLVEVAREVGGREVVKVPVQLPLKAAAPQSAKGATEVGAVTVSIRP